MNHAIPTPTTSKPSLAVTRATRLPNLGAIPSTDCDALRQCVREAARELGVAWLNRFMAAAGARRVVDIKPERLAAVLAFIA
jgi:hypothetical protein